MEERENTNAGITSMTTDVVVPSVDGRAMGKYKVNGVESAWHRDHFFLVDIRSQRDDDWSKHLCAYLDGDGVGGICENIVAPFQNLPPTFEENFQTKVSE